MWIRGCAIYFLLIAASFFGYILPWGQISLWGGTVITNFFSVISVDLVLWLWGEFSVGVSTLSLFFTLHFLTPLIIVVVVILHIILLHETGSSTKLFYSPMTTIWFGPRYFVKDSLNLVAIMIIICFFMLFPWYLGDSENFIEANSSLSPVHIKPEWYFLWAYAILRAIPSKTGGVLALLIAIVVIFILPFIKKKNNTKNSLFLKCFFIIIIFNLSLLGGCPVEAPFIFSSQIFTSLYFLFFLLI